jgi:PAS domain S-box-containing protein
MSSFDTDPTASSSRHRTVAGYVVVGVAWVLLSDVVLNDIGGVGLVGQSVKGALFVLVTAAVLAALLRQRDQRLAEQREARSLREEHLAATLEVVQDVVYRIELEPRRFSYVSPAIESLLGIAPEEVLSDAAAAGRFIHPDDRERRAETSGDGVIRLRWRHRDGRTVWTEQRNRVEERHGVPVAIIGVARDITEEVMGASVQEACSRLERAVLDGGSVDAALPDLAATLRTATEARRARIRVVGTAGTTPDVEVVDGAPARDEITLSVTAGPVRIEVVPSGYTPSEAVLTPLLERLVTRVHHAAHHAARRRELERVEVALRATGIAILLLDGVGHITWSNAAAVDWAFTRPDAPPTGWVHAWRPAAVPTAPGCGSSSRSALPGSRRPMRPTGRRMRTVTCPATRAINAGTAAPPRYRSRRPDPAPPP